MNFRSVLFVSAISSAIALGGCQQLDDLNEMNYVPNAVKETYPLSVERNSLSLRVPTQHPTLKSETEAEIMRLGYSASIGVNPIVTLSYPSNMNNNRSIQRSVIDALVRGGFSERRIRYSRHSGTDIIVSYTRTYAAAKKCGNWNDMTITGQNIIYENFGCAASANLAAVVANPDDLIVPHRSTPPDAVRRDNLITDYRAPSSTSTPYPQNDKQNVAGLGN